MNDIRINWKDHTVGLILLALPLLAIFAGIGIYVMPILIEAATNTAIFFFELAGLVLIPYIVWENRFSILLWYKNKARKIRRKIISDDPIGTLQTVLDRFNDKKTECTENLVTAEAAVKRQANAIKKAEDEASHNKSLAKAAESDEDRDNFLLIAAEWESTAKEMLPTLDTLRRIVQGMRDALALIGRQIKKVEGKKATAALKYDVWKSSQSAVKKFQSFFQSNPELEALEMSLDEVEIQTTKAEAEIETFLRNIAPAITQDRIERKAAIDQALQQFGNYAQKELPATTGSTPLIEGVVVKEKVAR